MPALALALLLPLALAACGEAGQNGEEDQADQAEPAQPPEEPGQTGEPAGDELDALTDELPLVDLDSGDFVLPEVIMPLQPGPGPGLEFVPGKNPVDGAAEDAPAEDGPGDLSLATPALAPAPPSRIPAGPAVASTTRVRALDKITARVIELDLPQDMEVRFGTLAIRARTCRSRPPEEPPETFAFLEIDDVKMNEERERIFSGWMMASSPALNALEHPVYDVWVIACRRS